MHSRQYGVCRMVACEELKVCTLHQGHHSKVQRFTLVRKNITRQVLYSQENLVGTGMRRPYAFRKSLTVITGGKSKQFLRLAQLQQYIHCNL
jgi:hypothetical protein